MRSQATEQYCGQSILPQQRFRGQERATHFSRAGISLLVCVCSHGHTLLSTPSRLPYDQCHAILSHRRAVGRGVFVGDHARRLIRKHLRVLAHRGGYDLLLRRHDEAAERG